MAQGRSWRSWRPASKPGNVARRGLLLVGAALAVVLVAVNLVPIVLDKLDGSPDIESAVASTWQGDPYNLWFAIGGGDPQVVGTDRESADEVTCAETDATLGGAPIHQCTIAYCDYDDPLGSCRYERMPACAALVSGQLVLVTRNMTTGPAKLRNELAGRDGC